MTDDIRAQIANRNLEPEGFGPRTALRHFSGRLESITYKERPETAKFPGTDIFFNFIEVEVIESTEPYDFPIAELQVGKLSTKEKSFWGVFVKSADKFLKPEQTVFDLEGAVLELQWTPGHMLFDGRKGEDVAQNAWELISVEGIAEKMTARDVALKLLDGKNLQEFNKAVLQDPVVRGDAVLQKSIIDKSFIKQLLAEEAVVVDKDGVYHIAN